MIFDAATNVRDLETQYNIVLPADTSYETIGGFVLNRLGFIPRGGESFEADGFRFTVMEMDHRRVSRVKIKPLRVPAAAGASEPRPQAAPEAQKKSKAAAAAENSSVATPSEKKASAKARRAK